MRVAVAGSGRLAVALLLALEDSAHELVAVVQNGRLTPRFYRGWLPGWLGVVAPNATAPGFARSRRLPLIYIDKMAADLEPLRAAAPDVLLVGGFSIILKRSLLELPAISCVNCHASLLPMHCGPNPFTAVLLAGEQQTGVTFHVMDEDIDTGPVLDQTAFPITGGDTAMTIYDRSCKVAANRVARVLDDIEAHGLHGTPQEPHAGCYDKKLAPKDYYLDWRRPAEELERKVRALTPFYIARCRFRGFTVRIYQARCDPAPAGAEPGTVLAAGRRPRIATGDGALIIHAAVCTLPFPAPWPAPLWRPRVGERLG